MNDGNDDGTQIGYQEGIVFYGIKNLTLQGEFNTVAPSTYEIKDNSYQNYDHYNQPLAHPLGNNFNEIVGIVNYKYKRLFTQVKINVADYFTSSSQEGKLTTLQAHLGFLINPKNNLSFLVGVNHRTYETNNFIDKTDYVYFSIQTSLRNLYTDF